MTENVDRLPETPTQAEVNGVPSFFADGYLGIATASGIARVSFAAVNFSVVDGAQDPVVKPVVTLIMPEAQLLNFAQEIISRSEQSLPR